MSRLINECSIKDTAMLRKLILDNPELPVIFFVSEDTYTGDYNYNLAYASSVEIENLTLYNETWLTKEDYEDLLYNDLADEEEFKDLSDEDYEKMIIKRVKETEFVKAIVIYID